ncbi:MAG: ParB/RepB/Spo0J family partition protein [Clostridiales bacterium]|nr:ParB/RepB/Spo0J family partition protein [Clostridiales bacterium]
MDKKRSGLGRGLDALFPGFDEESSSGSVLMVNVRENDTNPTQPRKSFNKETLQELAHSIKQHGIVQPLLVTKSGERFLIVAGERRYRAARMAGLWEVPVLLTACNPQEMAEVALIENIQRENLNPVEEASAIVFLMKQHDLSQEEVAKRIGKSRSAISNSIRLLSLPVDIVMAVEDGRLTAGHAKVLAGIADENRQLRLAEKALIEGWTVHRLEEEVRGVRKKKTTRSRKREISGDMREVLGELRMKYIARIDMTGTEKKGKIIFSYYTEQELDHLYQQLTEDR